MSIIGYSDRLSVRAGERVQFMLSATDETQADAQLVRLIHGDEHPSGPGFIEREVDAACNGTVAVSEQFTQAGSFVRVADPAGRLAPGGSFTVHAFIWPTTPRKGRQGILSQWREDTVSGFSLGIGDDGRLSLRLGDGTRSAEVGSDRDLVARVWYFVAASYDSETGEVSVYQEPVVSAYNGLLSAAFPRDDRSHRTATSTVRPTGSATEFLMAATHHDATVVRSLYNGKIDRSGIHHRVLSRAELDSMRDGGDPPADARVACWDPTVGYRDDGIGDTVVDTGPNGLHGEGYNRPIRAMTGYNWAGRNDCFRLAPGEFGGIQFNDDAIIDCNWPASVTWDVPRDFPSGVYALRVRAGAAEDHVTVFVRPESPKAAIAMLMPTASYLAYANERFSLAELPTVGVVTGHTLNLHDWDFLLAEHPEWGLSTYDHHADGAGVCYTSSRRPIMGMRPRHRTSVMSVPWQFPADLSIIAYLEHKGYAYDVITDEDLHREGVDCLRPYKVVLNGTHSEYYSEPMMDATEQYLAEGGRVMYMGGNGYYWVVAFREDEPWCMEVRKLDSGSRAWQASPGEGYLATTGERSGLWRNRGRSPQKLTGVGFTSEGMDRCVPYRRMPDSYDASCSWIFAGVDQEVFGDEGLALGGAAGLEVDRYDLALGTPATTKLLASSEMFSDNYPHVAEEIMFNFPGMGGTQDFQVRADMTYTETTGGGAIFSSGSIAWGQALPINDFDNDCARIMDNLLTRFTAE